MSRAITVDLDDPDVAQLEALHAELQRRHALRNVDPVLRGYLDRALPKIPEPKASEIRELLDTAHPAVVLREFWTEFSTARFGGAA